MNFGALLLAALKPLINAELSAIAKTITNDAPAIEAEAATAGGDAVAFVETKVTTLFKGNPIVSLAISTLAPALSGYLAGLEASGVNEVPKLLSEVVAWITKEEAVV